MNFSLIRKTAVFLKSCLSTSYVPKKWSFNIQNICHTTFWTHIKKSLRFRIFDITREDWPVSFLEEKAFFEKSCFKQFFTTEIYYLISATLSVKMPSGAKQFYPWRLSYSIKRAKKGRNLCTRNDSFLKMFVSNDFLDPIELTFQLAQKLWKNPRGPS